MDQGSKVIPFLHFSPSKGQVAPIPGEKKKKARRGYLCSCTRNTLSYLLILFAYQYRENNLENKLLWSVSLTIQDRHVHVLRRATRFLKRWLQSDYWHLHRVHTNFTLFASVKASLETILVIIMRSYGFLKMRSLPKALHTVITSQSYYCHHVLRMASSYHSTQVHF